MSYVTFGETIEEAIAMAQEAIELYLEDWAAISDYRKDDR